MSEPMATPEIQYVEGGGVLLRSSRRPTEIVRLDEDEWSAFIQLIQRQSRGRLVSIIGTWAETVETGDAL